jgi:hypothetical protein
VARARVCSELGACGEKAGEGKRLRKVEREGGTGVLSPRRGQAAAFIPVGNDGLCAGMQVLLIWRKTTGREAGLGPVGPCQRKERESVWPASAQNKERFFFFLQKYFLFLFCKQNSYFDSSKNSN